MRSVRGMWMGVGVSNLSIQGTRHGPHAHSLNLRLPTRLQRVLSFYPKAPCKSVQTARAFRTPRPRRLASPQLAS